MTLNNFLDYLKKIGYLSFNLGLESNDKRISEINQITWILYNEVIKSTEKADKENQ